MINEQTQFLLPPGAIIVCAVMDVYGGTAKDKHTTCHFSKTKAVHGKCQTNALALLFLANLKEVKLLCNSNNQVLRKRHFQLAQALKQKVQRHLQKHQKPPTHHLCSELCNMNLPN